MTRRRERLVAIAVLGIAVLAAVLILVRPAVSPRIAVEAPPPSAPVLLTPIEIVELPAAPAPSPPERSPPPPSPSQPLPPQSVPQPAPAPPPPVAQAPVASPPVKADPPPAITPPQPAPKPVQVAAVQPLKPTVPVAPPAKAVTPLKPEATPPVAELPAREPLVPLKIEEQDLERMRQARAEAKTIVPLTPDAPPPPAPPPIAPMRPAEPKVVPPPPQQLLIPPPQETAAAEPPPPVVKPEIPAPPPKPAITPPSAPPSAPPSVPPSAPVTGGTVGEGRALLRLLEKGSGPTIQIDWPAQSDERDRLYRILVDCFGMRDGLVDDGGRLYLAGGKPGEPSEFDTERYSGFVRRPEGAMAADEQREVARLNAYHRAQAAPVRVFPRHVDAYLISSLRQAVGENYLGVKTVRAAYRLNGGQVIVNAITVDGQRVNGTIDLAPVSNACGG